MSSYISTSYEYSRGSILGIMLKFSYNKYNIYRFFSYKNEKEKEIALNAANEVLAVLKKDLILPEDNKKNKNVNDDDHNMIPGAIYRHSVSGLIKNVFVDGVAIAFRLNFMKSDEHKNIREYYFIRDFNSIEEAWEAAMNAVHEHRNLEKKSSYTKISDNLIKNYNKFHGKCSDEVYNSVKLK